MITTATYTIDRASLGLSPLTIVGHDDGGASAYAMLLDGYAIPGRSWRRSYASSPFVHGDMLLGARLGNVAWVWPIQVTADSQAQSQTLVNALVEALSQFTYTATVTLDGVSQTWRCEPADYEPRPGAMFDRQVSAWLWSSAFTVPVYPIPGS